MLPGFLRIFFLFFVFVNVSTPSCRVPLAHRSVFTTKLRGSVGLGLGVHYCPSPVPVETSLWRCRTPNLPGLFVIWAPEEWTQRPLGNFIENRRLLVFPQR